MYLQTMSPNIQAEQTIGRVGSTGSAASVLARHWCSTILSRYHPIHPPTCSLSIILSMLMLCRYVTGQLAQRGRPTRTPYGIILYVQNKMDTRTRGQEHQTQERSGCYTHFSGNTRFVSPGNFWSQARRANFRNGGGGEKKFLLHANCI